MATSRLRGFLDRRIPYLLVTLLLASMLAVRIVVMIRQILDIYAQYYLNVA